MPVYKLNISVKIFSNSEYGERLIFVNGPTNPRDVLGKNGITFHNELSKGLHPHIPLELDLITQNNKKIKRLFYVNKNSLIKYLLGMDPTFNAVHSTEKELVDKLRSSLWQIQDLNNPNHEEAKKQGLAGEKTLRHAGRHNKGYLYGWQKGITDSTTGRLVAWLYQKAISGVYKLKALFFIFARTEAAQLQTSEILARTQFKKAAVTVPAYREHLKINKQLTMDATFADIPITTKDNYIKKNGSHDWDLHNEGRYPLNNKTDTSTGTTGKPTPWVRSSEEVDTVKKSLQIAAEVEFGKRPIEYINALAFGPWATGMTTYEFMRATGSVFASGPDMDKILDKLEALYAYQQAQLEKRVKEYTYRDINLVTKTTKIKLIIGTMVEQLVLHDKLEPITQDSYPEFKNHYANLKKLAFEIYAARSQIILGGYPPFFKDLIEHAAKKGINFRKYQAKALVGGQATSEALREKLIAGGFMRVTSNYGASDLDINLGVETNFNLRLRKALEKNPGLARELYGSNKSVPMVFSYDPLNYHVEVNEDDELIFTCNRSDRSSPRIRYDLGDKGRVYTSSDIQALLVKYGIDNLKPKNNLPLLFVWGRDADLIYAGANLNFIDLERAVAKEDKAGDCLKYAFYSYEDQNGIEQFDIWVELKEGVDIPEEKESKYFLSKMLTHMASTNQDFAYQLKNLPEGTELPGIRYFARKTSPIQDVDGHRKQVLIYKNGKNLDAHYQYPESSVRSSFPMTAGFKAMLSAKKVREVKSQDKLVSSLGKFAKAPVHESKEQAQMVTSAISARLG